MAQASKRTRQIRKLKRQHTLLMRMAEKVLNERDLARVVANAAIKELEKHAERPKTTIKVIEDEPIHSMEAEAAAHGLTSADIGNE